MVSLLARVQCHEDGRIASPRWTTAKNGLCNQCMAGDVSIHSRPHGKQPGTSESDSRTFTKVGCRDFIVLHVFTYSFALVKHDTSRISSRSAASSKCKNHLLALPKINTQEGLRDIEAKQGDHIRSE